MSPLNQQPFSSSSRKSKIQVLEDSRAWKENHISKSHAEPVEKQAYLFTMVTYMKFLAAEPKFNV